MLLYRYLMFFDESLRYVYILSTVRYLFELKQTGHLHDISTGIPQH